MTGCDVAVETKEEGEAEHGMCRFVVYLIILASFNYAINGQQVSTDDDNYDSFVKAVNSFVNETNGYLPNGAQSGIFLNTFDASVFAYDLVLNFYSTTATLKNIKMNGMKHNMTENIRMDEPTSANIMETALVASINVEELFADTRDDGLQSATINQGVLGEKSFLQSEQPAVRYDSYDACNF